MNVSLFRWINGWPESWSPVLRFFSEAMNYPWFKVAVAVLAIGMIVAGGRARPTVIQALIAWPIANFATDLLKNFVPQHRPFQEMPDVALRAGWSASFGTASAHSANMAAIAFVFTYGLGWRWGAPWVAIALITGLSRIYVGVHYPSQVLLGWTCGVLAGLLVTKTWERIQKARGAVQDRRTDGEAGFSNHS